MLLIIMVVTIQQVLRPLLIICFIMGLGSYPMKQPHSRIRWIVYLSISYRLTVWFSYAYFLYYTITFFTWKVLYPKIINKVLMIINIITTITSVIMSFYHQKRLEIILQKLSAVDNSLKALGIPMMYRRIHTYAKLIIIWWIIYSLFLNFSDTLWWTNIDQTNSWGLFLSYILNHCFNINAFVELLFVFFLWCISTRFDKLNEYLRFLLVREDYGLRCTWKKSMVAFHRYTLRTNYKQTLWTSMHLHLELCRIARELNFIFGIHIIFVMAMCFVMMTSLCYVLCLMSTGTGSKKALEFPHIWFHISSWIFALLIRIYSVNYICESVIIKAKEINNIIHQLTNTFRYVDVQKEIYQFTLQVMHHPLKLTGMNLFYLGNECFQKFCITMVMFVIIMVQMKVSINPLDD